MNNILPSLNQGRYLKQAEGSCSFTAPCKAFFWQCTQAFKTCESGPSEREFPYLAWLPQPVCFNSGAPQGWGSLSDGGADGVARQCPQAHQPGSQHGCWGNLTRCAPANARENEFYCFGTWFADKVHLLLILNYSRSSEKTQINQPKKRLWEKQYY